MIKAYGAMMVEADPVPTMPFVGLGETLDTEVAATVFNPPQPVGRTRARALPRGVDIELEHCHVA